MHSESYRHPLTPTGPSWLAEVRARGARAAAVALGFEVPERPGYGAGPCPSCGAERRHPSRRDRRGALGFTPDGQGWRCFQCDAHGDAVGLVALATLGRKPAAGDREAWREVRVRAAAVGLCEPDNRGTRQSTNVRTLPRPPPPVPPAPPRRPPPAEVATLWNACRPVTTDPEVRAWLEGRRLDAGAVEDLDLVRALPADLEDSSGFQSAADLARPRRAPSLPSWARFAGLPWNLAPQGFRAVFPLFGAGGALESVRVRALRPEAVNGSDKAGAAAGFEVRGLVLADGLTRRLLASDADAAELVRANGLVVLEGEPDFLTWATRWGEAGAAKAPAVLGLVSGSWCAELAERVPSGTRVFVRTHLDDAGERYARQVIETLTGRCDLRRLKGAGRAA